MAYPLLSVIIPVFNEVRTIEQLLERVTSVPIDKEIIIVDDGSYDGTSELLKTLRNESVSHVLTHDVNLGKGMAIRTGLRYASGEYVIVQDGDLELDPEIYPELLRPLLEEEAEIVVGTRFLSSKRRLTRFLSAHWIAIQLLNLCLWFLYKVRLSDYACCYKVLRTQDIVAMDLLSTRFEFCAEVVAKAARLGFRFREIPVKYKKRSKAHGKKIRLRDAVDALLTFWKWRKWQPSCPYTVSFAKSRSVNIGKQD